MPRRLAYVSGTRADFGLMRRALLAIHAQDDLELGVWVTGTHLDAFYGNTVHEIESAGLRIDVRCPLGLAGPSAQAMAKAVGVMVQEMTLSWAANPPDMILLLGDRGEMLAGATAALYLGIPTMHIHGGERSGTVDEPVRHAISKLSSYHACATAQSAQRLHRMGEVTARVRIVGAPGLEGIDTDADAGQADLARELKAWGWAADRSYFLCAFHPVVQQASQSKQQAQLLVDALRRRCEGLSMACIWIAPNSDAGASAIDEVLGVVQKEPWLRVVRHWPRNTFCAAMRDAVAVVGNSSAGIIEAASFSTPVLNLGDRQRLRETSANVTHAAVEFVAMEAALARVCAAGRARVQNVYGDGHAAERLIDFIRAVPLGVGATEKTNAY